MQEFLNQTRPFVQKMQESLHKRSSEMRNSLECGGSTPLWPAAARHRVCQGGTELIKTATVKRTKAASSRRTPNIFPVALRDKLTYTVAPPQASGESLLPPETPTYNLNSHLKLLRRHNYVNRPSQLFEIRNHDHTFRRPRS